MIFFDIDGTLINHALASAQASLDFYDTFPGMIAFPRNGFADVWEAIVDKHFDRYCRGEISIWEQRRARMREVFGDANLPDHECDQRYCVYISKYESLTAPHEDAQPCLEELRGMPLGIISNGARDQQLGKLERVGLLKYFSVLVFSEDAGIGKPDARIFQEACRRAGRQAINCVHVGDNLDADINGSASAGLQPVWISRNLDGSSPASVPRISSLAELTSVLKLELNATR